MFCFRQASNHCQRVLEAAKLAYANKIRESFLRNLTLGTFGELLVPNKAKSAIPCLFNSSEVFSSVSDKAKLFAENFSKNSNLDGLDISLPVFPFSTNLKLHDISVTPRLIKKVIANHDLLKVYVPDCVSVVILKIY